jgi:hypothetical protein
MRRAAYEMTYQYRAVRHISFGSPSELAEAIHQITNVLFAINAVRGPIRRITTSVLADRPDDDAEDAPNRHVPCRKDAEAGTRVAAFIEINIWTEENAPDPAGRFEVTE